MNPTETTRGENGGEAERPARPKSASVQVTLGSGARWDAPKAEDLADSFPGIRVKSLCGVGGMGAVYRAEQIRLGRDVAVKILPPVATPDNTARERFEREARILSGLNHPHILHLHDFGSLPDSTLYLVMEWAGGGDLATLLNGKPQPLEKVIEMVRQISEALSAAHARGVIHRDLKPANVLVLEDGRLTLADFGLAHATGAAAAATLTQSGVIFGTFDYMAPEQMESAAHVTPAADLYALGVMTYLMVTGRLPRGAYARPSRITGAPEAVDAFLNSAMATEPGKRPADAKAFARGFEFACRSPERRRQRQLIVLGVALVVLALAWARAAIINSEREAFAREQEAAALAGEQKAARLEARREAQNEQLRQIEIAEAAAAAGVEPPPLAEIVVPIVESAASPQEPPSGGTAKADMPAETPAPVESGAASGSLPETATTDPVIVPPGILGTEAAPEPPVKPATDTETKASLPAVPWVWVLPDVKPAENAVSGEWRLSRGELVSGEGRCALSLPVRLAINYDVAVEFTRNSGRNSVAVFLPTLSGVGVFEIDAWELGIGGLQMIDGADMRRTSRYFPTALANGELHRLILEVRGAKVSATWNGVPRMSWDVTKNRLRIPPLWEVRPDIGLGIGSWSSPTTFHRIAYRSYPLEPASAP